jgi:hypothetical protein
VGRSGRAEREEGGTERGRRQLEFPVFEGSIIFATSYFSEGCDDHGWTSTEAVAGFGFRMEVGRVGQEGGCGRENGTQVSQIAEASEHGEATAHVPDAEGSFRRGMASGGIAPAERTGASGEDPLRLGQGAAPGQVRGQSSPHVGATRSPLAGDLRSSSGGDVQSVASRWGPGRFGLHRDEFVGNYRRRPAIQATGVPLRAHLLELGNGDAVCVRVVRGVIGRSAERALGTGWSPTAASE